MPVKDLRPQIKLSKDEEDRLKRRLDEMIQEADEFRTSADWESLHSLYWRMYMCEPEQSVRTWPWDASSNLFMPMTKVAVNATVAQEFDAMLSQDPQVIGFESDDLQLAEDLTAYYFDYFYKEVLPINIWGTDLLLNNTVDGTSAMETWQNVDFEVRREETLEQAQMPAVEMMVPDAIGIDRPQPAPDFNWTEKATIERIDETTATVSDLEKIYVAPGSTISGNTVSAMQWPGCPWYFVKTELTWETLVARKRSAGYQISENLKAFLGVAEPTDKEDLIASREGVDASARPETLRVLQYYMRWPLPMRYRYYSDANPLGEDLKQNQGEEDGHLEEVVVTYAPDAKEILLIRPLSRVCPDGKRPHTDMRYRRIPGWYGIGLPSDMRDLQSAMNSSVNQEIDYGTLCNLPWGFYSPANSGLLPQQGAISPGTFYEVNDPRGIQTFNFRMDPNFYNSVQNVIQAWGEKVANVSDVQLGRSPTTPNAPRTARGQLAMIQMGNIAFSILSAVHSMSFIEVFKRIHAFKKRWAKPVEIFRVMNKQTGMFQKRQVTDRAFKADVDFQFRLNPNKAAEQQRAQGLFSMIISAVQQAIAAPMLANMIRELTREAAVSLGYKNFDVIWPKNLVQNIAIQAMGNQGQGQQPPPQEGQPSPEQVKPQGGTQEQSYATNAVQNLQMPSTQGIV